MVSTEHVNDAEPAHAEPDAFGKVETLVVRTAVGNRLRQYGQGRPG